MTCTTREFAGGIEYTYDTDAEAHAARRGFINQGRAVSLIAYDGNGYTFDVYAA